MAFDKSSFNLFLSSNFNIQFFLHASDFFPIAFIRNNLLTVVNTDLFGHHFLLILKPYVPTKTFFYLLFFLFFSLLSVQLSCLRLIYSHQDLAAFEAISF